MKDDVLARIQRALDERTNLEEDLELQRTFAMDPEAAQVASELAAIDEALRGMRDPMLSEADLDRLVGSIEERLDEALPPMADPTAPPALDDDEDPAAAGAPAAGQETRELSALAAPERVSLDSLPPDLLESLPPESPADLPPPRPVSLKPIERTGERFSFTSVAPPPPLHTLPPVSDRPPGPAQTKSRTGVVVALFGGTLAAAAGVVLVLFLTTSREEDLAYAPPGEAQPNSALQLDEALPAAPVTADPHSVATPEATEQAQPGRGGGFFGGNAYDGAEGDDGSSGGPLGTVGGVEQQDQPALERSVREAVRTEARARRDAEENDRDSLVETVSEPEEEEPADDPREPPVQGATSSPRGATPSRDEVIAAMRSVVPAVAACGGGARSGVAEVRIRVGSSGRVQSSVVIGQFAGTPEGSCIARAARGARFQPFSQASFEFTYPFRLE